MELFRKEIKLPLEMKKDLKVQAAEEGYPSLKNMIEVKIIEGLEEFRNTQKKC